ncbi:hypothetical protein EMIHUDRAFT_451837 [Emiliania huxleyi CCMP1516]|uniref:Peroxin/Ferlin domain-containing protein n=2 Tax=Emiliania huxleyi TaxID=2903 RepID=A0A0D3IRZ8_EMIH1|nr:hypothetical protein EMIHUDRAFT_451837 [Emiliania huxleyi CCMP1516]EOD14033.1 hypothetical protein EMIHUDRAFT_451837 [Emiliania huxleyi CCMP1516]|eukprot:XP_005766462.1 hypothetical protein EMIHUDRAFT_451837 [Emiliania huxleyi CCMP1516]
MFESIALSVLERVLGQYVEDIDRNSLKVAVWKGHITLERLKLRREALYAWGLPLDIKAGYIERAELQLPWNRLGSEPVTITLDGIYLVASPVDESRSDEGAKREWRWARKQARIDHLSAQRSTAEGGKRASETEAEADGGGAGQGGRLSLLTRIVNNVQLSFRSVHVRYEDALNSTAPFALGATLAELSVYSADERGERAYNADGSVQYKVAALRCLAVYHHCACDRVLQPDATLDAAARWLRGLAATTVSLSALEVRLAEQQLRDCSRLAEFVHRFQASALSGGTSSAADNDALLRPIVGGPSARSAWRLALRRIVAEGRRQRGWRLGAGFFEARREVRLRYVGLYKREQGASPELEPSEARELRALERDQLSPASLENAPAVVDGELEVEGTPLSSEQREQLAALLAGTPPPEEEAAEDGDAGSVEYELRARLDELSLVLVEAAPPESEGGAAASASVARLTLSRLHAASLYAGTLVEGSLAGVELTDCTAAFGSFGAAVLQPVDQRLEVTVATPLELVHNARLLDRVRRFLDVLGESERAELAQLVRQQAESLREVTLESVILSPSKASLRAAPERAHYLVYELGVDVGLQRCILPPSSHAFNHVVVSGSPSPKRGWAGEESRGVPNGKLRIGSLSEASSQSLHLQLSPEQLRMAAAILESLQSGTAEPAGEAGVPAALAAEGADLPAGAQPLATIERTRARFLVQRVRLSLVGREGAPLASLHAGGIELTAHRDVAGQGAHFRLDELYVDDRTAADPLRSRLVESNPSRASAGGGPEESSLVQLQYLRSAAGAADELHALSVSLNVQGGAAQQLGVFAMRELVTEVSFLPEGGMSVSGQLGNLTVQDTSTVAGGEYEMLGLREGAQSLLTFDSVRVSYWHPAVMRIVGYLQEGVLGALMSATASTVVQVARSVLADGAEDASAIALDIEVGSPLVLLPFEPDSSDGLRGDLGSIAVHNSLERRTAAGPGGGGAELLDCIVVAIERMQLSALLPEGEGALEATGGLSQMIEDVSLRLSVERGVGASAGRATLISGSGSELVCTCSKAQMDLVLPAVELALEDGGGPLLLAWMGGVRIGARQSADSAVYSVSSAALAVQDCRGDGYPSGRGTRPADSTGSRLKRLLWSDPAAEPAAASSAQLSVSHSVERLPGRGHEAATRVSESGVHITYAASAFRAAADFFSRSEGGGDGLLSAEEEAEALARPLSGPIGAVASPMVSPMVERLVSLPEEEEVADLGRRVFLPRDPSLDSTGGIALRGAASGAGAARRRASAICVKRRGSGRDVQVDADALDVQLLVCDAVGEQTTTVLAPTQMSLRFSGGPRRSELARCGGRRRGRPATPPDSAAATLSRGAAAGVQLAVSAELESLRVVAINDLHGRAEPLAALTLTSVVASCAGSDAKLVVACSACAQMHLHNPRLVAWEPLWEPWRFHVRGKLSPSDEPPFTEVKVHADEACNINISLSMCELVSGTTLTLIDDITGVAQPLVCDLRLRPDGCREARLLSDPLPRRPELLRGASATARAVRLLSDTTLHNQTADLLEAVHPLPAGAMLPLPLRPDRASYRLHLRPMDGGHAWSPACQAPTIPTLPGTDQSGLGRLLLTAASRAPQLPGYDGAADAGALHAPLECASEEPGADADGRHGAAWHCGACEVHVRAPLQLGSPAVGPARFEYQWLGGILRGELPSGGRRLVHTFAPATAVSLSVSIEGYRPSERVLAPHTALEGVLCEEVPVYDGRHSRLPLSIGYERLHGCVHALSLVAPCWVSNCTGLPLLLREHGAREAYCGDEPAVVCETVSENQRRRTAFNSFSADGLFPTDFAGAFSDERLSRRHSGLADLWLPTGWLWMEDWRLKGGKTGSVTEQGWEYAKGWSGAWSPQCTPKTGVRRRLWTRRRVRLSGLTRHLLGGMSENAVRRLSLAELQQVMQTLGEPAQRGADELRQYCMELRARAQERGGAEPDEAAGAAAAPVMPPVTARKRLELRLPGSCWSSAVSLEAAGTSGLLELPAGRGGGSAPSDGGPPRAYQLALGVTSAPGESCRSKMLVVEHRTTLLNRLDRPVGYVHHGKGGHTAALLRPGERAPFHWQDEPGLARLLSVCLLDAGADAASLAECDWSNALPIDSVGEPVPGSELNLVCRLSNRRTVLFLSVDVQLLSGASMLVVFSERTAELAPYRVDNLSALPLLISQSPCAALQQPRVVQEVLPASRAPFAWEQAVVAAPTLDLHVGRSVRKVCLDDLQRSGTIPCADPRASGAPHEPSSVIAAPRSAFGDGAGEWNGYRDVRLESLHEGVATTRLPGSIARAEVRARHSQREGRFGWHGDELWTADGLRATFRVFFVRWGLEVDLDSRGMRRSEVDLRHAVAHAAVQSQRSASDGSFGWSDSTLWVDEGLRARFAVTLQRDALPGSRPPLELRYRMVADGPVKVLQVMPAPSAAASGEVPSLPVLASEEDDGKLRLSVHVSLACLGVSLIADGCEELLYLSLVDPVVSYRASSGRDFLSAQVRHLQVDNQLQAASFPVLLQPSFSAEEAQQAVRPHSLELLVQRRIGAAQVLYYETVSLRLQTLELMVDTVLVRTLFLFVLSTYLDLAKMATAVVEATTRGQPRRADAVVPPKVYLRWLNLQPLRLHLSCRSVAGGRRREAAVLENAPASAVGVLNSVSAVLSNIDSAPLQLKALVLDNTFAPVGTLAQAIGDSYREQLLQQLYKLLLSVELLGNPRGLFQHLATGVTDAFYEPLNGIMRGPDDSLANNLTYGLSDSVQQQEGPRNIGEGLLQTAESVSGGLRQRAATAKTGGRAERSRGLCAQRGGFGGFFKGVAQGAVGLVVKPAVGVADGITAAAEGLKSQTTVLRGLTRRRRQPRTFGLWGELRLFSNADARIQRALYDAVTGRGVRSLASGRFCSQVPCASPPQAEISLVVTTGHAILLSVSGEGGAGSSSSGGGGGGAPATALVWSEPLSQIAVWECVERSHELALHLRSGEVRRARFPSAAARAKAVRLIEQAVKLDESSTSRAPRR